MRRYNDMMQESTQLQLQLARQHNEIATLQGQLHRGGFTGNLPLNLQALQHQVHDLQSQLLIAKERAQTVETRLKDSVSKFNSAYAEQRDCIKGLERQLKELKPAGSGHRSGKGRTKGVDNELASTKADLKMKNNFASLQKQSEAEKQGNTAMGSFPAPAAGKQRGVADDDDQDDEEPSNPFMKEEPGLEEHTIPEPGLPEPELIEDQITVKPEPEAEPMAFSGTITIKEEEPAPEPSEDSAISAALNASRRGSSVLEVISTTNISMPVAAEESSAPEPQHDVQEDDTILVSSSKSTRSSFKRIKIEDGTPPPPRSRKRRRQTYQEPFNVIEINEEEQPPARFAKQSRHSHAHSRQDLLVHLQKTFEFNAVTEHHPNDEISAFDSKEDLQDETKLWNKIQQVHPEWVKVSGEDWKDEFEVKMRDQPCTEQCVTERLKGGAKSVWREGGEGKFACEKCVEFERPCFAWTGEEFWLLPLHEQDRKEEVQEDCDLRHWVNE